MTNTQHPYTQILKVFTDREMAVIVQLKRFFELMEGDPFFNASVQTNNLSSIQIQRLKSIGINFDVRQLALLWKEPDIFSRYSDILKCSSTEAKIADGDVKAMRRYPLLDMWFHYCRLKKKLYLESRKTTSRISNNLPFQAWRQRRIAATKSELGLFGYHIDHPILSFELGDGCTIGCWFCAFSTKKLTRNYDYRSNKAVFREIIRRCVHLFGKEGAGMALLYYGTEPHDNPDYINFLHDYQSITGRPLCTSTTAGTDAAWIRQLIDFYRKWNYPWPRLSILSTKMLYEIHDLFSPDELRDVPMAMQIKGPKRKLVTSGRILQEQKGLKEREPGHYLEGIIPQGSIACTSGFLVNMAQKTIQLISPCYTTKEWPTGYRIFDSDTFEDAESFQKTIEALIRQNMPENPFPEEKVAFRDDLIYRQTSKGFDLISPNQIHHFHGPRLYHDFGNKASTSQLTYKELFDSLVDSGHHNPLVISHLIQQLFNAGLLNEVYRQLPRR